MARVGDNLCKKLGGGERCVPIMYKGLEPRLDTSSVSCKCDQLEK